MTTISPVRPHAHHHGNLREALIEAGLTLLNTEGTSGMSLRKCAALAGVSHAAPAHHFNGLPGLLDAIAARGFHQFADEMEARAAAGPDAPRARLEAICVAYYDFAKANPAVFDLMFRQIWSLAGNSEELGVAGARAYRVLADACAPFIPEGEDPGVVETQVWSLVHGYSALALPGKLGRIRPVPPVEAVLQLLQELELVE